MVIFIVFLFRLDIPLFGFIWSRNPKFNLPENQHVSLSWNLVFRLFEIDKSWWRCSFFVCVRQYFASFSKKIIWLVHVNWLISHQFTCRDLKPVAFLVTYKLDWKKRIISDYYYFFFRVFCENFSLYWYIVSFLLTFELAKGWYSNTLITIFMLYRIIFKMISRKTVVA